MADRLEVYLHDNRIATVARAPRRTREFVQLTWAEDFESSAVRLTESFAAIPGRAPAVNLVSRFLGGYAPEGNQRRAMAAERGIHERDLFGLLSEFGGSIAGALTFRLPDEPQRYEPSYEELSDAALRRLMKKAIEDHDQGIRDDSRSMIQGFQPKLLVAKLGDSDWLLPRGRAHSTHILKPQLASRPHKVVDEFYSHELARHAALAGFRSELLTVGPTRYLAIERFDRVVAGATVHLVHQEDAAQALGLEWTDDEAKFQDRTRQNSPERPSAYRIAEMVAGLGDDAVLHTWLRQLIFRVLVGDNDGHAKNVGILHLPGEDRLTDLYDAVPNLHQEGRIDWTMAFAIGGEFDHRKVSVDRIAEEAQSWGVLGRSAIETTIADSLARFTDALSHVRVPRGVSPGLRDAFEWNASRLVDGKQISERRH
ncbi:type II toxin-antitoxin system HipA family toxin [Agromyces bauzanensis]|uniref:Kinase n=1 Tax=Agromyces bauzanensis TaxID=1308924 RepID=A0A917UV74_9MICO|nr:HipA domain-containing protein [Agromyces bauzanensis]GGJ87124.1 kinase [Agromyces bauzanensis]